MGRSRRLLRLAFIAIAIECLVGDWGSFSGGEAIARELSTLTQVQGPDETIYQLVHRISKGSFGDVWMVKSLSDGREYAMKFFSDSQLAAKHAQHADLIAQSLASVKAKYLLRIDPSLEVTEVGGVRKYQVIRSELGSSKNAEARASEDFRLYADLGPAERKRKIMNLTQLLENLTHGSEELFRMGLVHHDINPRNVIRVGDVYKIGDFDGVTAIGLAPPDKSFEPGHAPPEYNREYFSSIPMGPERDVALGPAGDLWTIASTVHFLMTGESPYQAYLTEQFYKSHPPAQISHQTKEELAAKLKEFSIGIRRELVADPVRREDFRAWIVRRVKSITPAMVKMSKAPIPPDQIKYLNEIEKFTLAALELDPVARLAAVKAVRPDLAHFSSPHPITLISRIAGEVTRCSIEGMKKLIPKAHAH